MRICGLKLTHDSTVAVIDEGKLVFSIELEKISNNSRFKIFDDLCDVEKILTRNGLAISEIDAFVIDGWLGENQATVRTVNNNIAVQLPVASYMESTVDENLLHPFLGQTCIGSRPVNYSSYLHVTGHIFSAYATSPFAKKGEPSYVLIWDGGMPPRLYYFDVHGRRIECLGELFYMGVNIYSIFAQFFSPFKINDNVIKDELSIAGKVMAYEAFGNVSEEIIADMEWVYEQLYQRAGRRLSISDLPYEYAKIFRRVTAGKNYYDEDIIASFHHYLERKILHELEKRNYYCNRNLCIAGGAGLNIKWNSAVKRKALFENVWVCPFPNDSGSAIGMASCENFIRTGRPDIDWDVYKGPELILNEPVRGWGMKHCPVEELAYILHHIGEPVVFLQGQAELGPRALGNRSILAPAQSCKMKDILNYIKFREAYRPVAPVCLEDDAAGIFDPGHPDPYMLFDHCVRHEWRQKVPAIMHKDNTARLQTVSEQSNPGLYRLLSAYKKLSGIPLLCNTSANYKGCGFFPDIFNATRWNKVNYVWANETLDEKEEKIIFS
jgi:carbamoyltransferase